MTRPSEQSDRGCTTVAPQFPPSITKKDGYLHLPSNSRLPRTGIKGDALPTRKAAFLDRDGVVVEDVHFLTSVDQLKVLPGVANALRLLQDRFFIIVVTNQSGVARGFLTEEDLMTIHTELTNLLTSEGVTVDALYYCPHLPEAVVPAYKSECTCRKPEPGMLLQAADDWGIDLFQSCMVGDSPRDIEAARRAGVRGIIVGDKAQDVHRGVPIVPDLAAAVSLMLEKEFPLSHVAEAQGQTPGPTQRFINKGGN